MKWLAVDALRQVQSILARDLVRARKVAREGDGDPRLAADVEEHSAVLTFITAKLLENNVRYYEADETRQAEYERQRTAGAVAPVNAHGHEHGHTH